MKTKEEIIKELGKNDGLDEYRYDEAFRLGMLTDHSPFTAFRSLINLEEKGYIKLTTNKKKDLTGKSEA